MHDAEDAIRRAEAELVVPFVRPGLRVLELGPGTGLQASVLAAAGAHVVGVEVPGRERRLGSGVPVAEYDGAHLPLADGSVDLVYSSSVLEHVVDLEALLADTARVLTPGGRSVHVVPTTTWRIATIVAHYPHLLGRLAARLGRRGGSDGQAPGGAPTPTAGGPPGPAPSRWRRVLPDVHGEHPDLRSEVAAFRREAWRRRFVEAGWTIDLVQPAGLVYSGYGVAASVPLRWRGRLAHVLGSSSLLLVVRPPTERSAGDVR